MTLNTLMPIKENLAAALESVAKLASEAGMPSLHDRVVNDRLPRLREERLVLVVLGEFNHGKTTFVNALLGGEVLPSGVTPTTAIIHEVRHAEQPHATVVLRPKEGVAGGIVDPLRIVGGERRELAWDRLQTLVVGGEFNPEDILRVEIGYPAEMLRERVTLVDTPGVNDINQQRAEITYGYVPRADAIVFLLDAGQVLKESERKFLREKLLGAGRDRIVFAINKSDSLDEGEREQVLAYAKKQLAQIVPGAPVLLISADKALNGDRAASGFDPLMAELNELLGEHRLRTLLDLGADEGQRISSLLLRGLEVRRRALTMKEDELERRIAALEKDFESSKDAVAARQRTVAEEIGAIRAVARRDLYAFAEQFAEALPAQIEQQSAEDVRKFLPGFIEDTWKKWLEREGQVLGGKLETLAETIVAIVNEDARDVSHKLKEFVGDATRNVDVKVDTFRYDASVFALGAFGASVMVLSNFLVGGLLILAAPILALVFKDRVDKEVKKKAIESAPEAVRQAARKIEPELVSSIDRFGEKLSEFVALASEELRRSILEVLTSTKTSLTAVRTGTTPPLGEVDAWIDRTRSGLEGFKKLRDQVWEGASNPTRAPAPATSANP